MEKKTIPSLRTSSSCSVTLVSLIPQTLFFFSPASLLDNLNCNGDPLVQCQQDQKQNTQDNTKNNGCKTKGIFSKVT